MKMKIGRYKIEGSGRNIKLHYNNDSVSFKYRGITYHLSDFLRLTEGELAGNGFSGVMSFTAFSGLLIKVISDDYVQVYRFNTMA